MLCDVMMNRTKKKKKKKKKTMQGDICPTEYYISNGSCKQMHSVHILPYRSG